MARMRSDTKDYGWEIIKELGVLSETKSGWRRELNLVSWDGNKPQYDIRDWNPDHTKMSKGVSLSEKQFDKLKYIISNM